MASVDPAGASPAVPVLGAAVEGADIESAIQAAHALGTLGPAARGAVGALRRAAGSSDEMLSRAATMALEKVSP